jgi:subtilisin family serine protease
MTKRQGIIRFSACLFLMFLIFTSFMAKAKGFRDQKAWWIVLDTCEHSDAAFVADVFRSNGIIVRSHSVWLNAVSVEADANDLKWIGSNYHVTELRPVLKLKSNLQVYAHSLYYATALEQMQAAAFWREGLSGLGVKVGVTDAGFLFMNNPAAFPGLKRLFANRQILGAKDFVRNIDTVSYSESFYSGKRADRRPWNPVGKTLRYLRLVYHTHGSEIMSALAGFDIVSSYQSGLALDAYYYLTRTEEGNKEYKEEEDYYIAALEWLHSKGVRIVNTSLGYGEGRRRKKDNYRPTDMNGQSMIARAVETACKQKGMLVVVAAGNEGDKKRWQVISTPGDAPSALTVGAVNGSMMKEAYSGKGPDYNTYIKPDVSAYSLSGTSLSAPAVAGFAACLLEERPELTPAMLKEIIVRSSHLYPYGNNYIGYGVPLAGRALALLSDSTKNFGTAREVHNSGNVFELSDPGFQYPYIVCFHKKNEWVVVKQELLKSANERGLYIINKPEGVTRTTVQAGFSVFEVLWGE